jgi:DNA-binding PadR family transcriptional regulator
MPCDTTSSVSVSLLEGALLGLLAVEPQSGYALRKAFQETPLGHFSDSPGSIYPALARLKARGWTDGTIDRSRALRPREIFALTPAGQNALRAWLSEPVTRATVSRGCDGALLRFAFMEATLGRKATAEFLSALARELAAHLEDVRRYMRAEGPGLPLTGRLALEIGLTTIEAQLRWARRAARHFRTPHGTSGHRQPKEVRT